MNKKLLLLVAFGCFLQSYAQITFRGCTASGLGDQDYNLVQTGTTNDAGTIRNTFESNPADFTQSCPAGVCEVRIIWNIGAARWEVQLDNDGPLNTPDYTTAVLYFNTNASEPNPPSMTLGGWQDGAGGVCPVVEITTLAGDVQDVILGIHNADELSKEVKVLPNPVDTIFSIVSDLHSIKKVTIYSLLGQEVKVVTANFESIDVTNLAANIYMIKIETNKGGILTKRLMIN